MKPEGLNYRMENLGINFLVGKKVISAKINSYKDLIVLDTDKGKIYLTWEGNCCAKCFIANISGTSSLVGEILSAENTQFYRIDGEYETIETMGTTLRTEKGHITLETRVEHNGYYGGEIIISDIYPVDQYACPRDNFEEDKLFDLVDF